MRGFAAVLPLLILGIACAPSHTVIRGSQPFSEPATGLEFHSRICGLPKRQVSMYAGKQPRVSVHYENDDLIKATFYVCDPGDSDIGKGPESDAVRTYLRRTVWEITEMHRLGRYGKADFGELDRLPIRLGAQRLEALCVFCELSTGPLDLGSFVLVTGYRGRLFKIRYTYPEELEESAREKWECILRAFGDAGG